MNWELITALVALVTAIAAAGTGIFQFGRLAQRVDQLEKDSGRLETEIDRVREDSKDMMSKIEEKLDRIWDWLHENVQRHDSKPD